MKHLLKWPTNLIGFASVILAMALAFAFQRLDRSPTTTQATSLSPSMTATVTEVTALTTEPPLMATDSIKVTPEELLGPPTTTPVPIPTLTATPAVTSLPTTQPPLIPFSPGTKPKPLTLIYGRNNVVWSINDDGSGERMIADVGAQTSQFLPGSEKINGDTSPDGQLLALTLSTTAETSQERGASPPQHSVYLLDMNTGNIHLLIENSHSPHWSPDGTRIAYVSTTTNALHVLDVATRETHLVYQADAEKEHFVTDVDWSPNSDQLVFIDQVFRQSSSIMVVDVMNPESAHEIGPDPLHHSLFPTWSPTGDEIAYLSTADVESDYSIPQYNLWTVAPDSTNRRQLTHEIDAIGSPPQWSSDGKWIAFAGTPPYEEKTLYELWLTDSTGSILKRLTSNAVDHTNESIYGWSTDGTYLFFLRDLRELWSVSLLDGSQRKLPVEAADALIIQSATQE